MKIRKIHTWLLLAAVALTQQSCLKDQEDVFDEPSSLRMEKYLSQAKETLVSSPNGWVLDYYPELSRIYGGYTYTLKFDNDNVTAMLEGEEGEKETSLYKLTDDNGPVLSFDGYNTLLHAFATPSSSMYEGLNGDFEFVIDSIGSDMIKLHGKRIKNTMYLRKLNEDMGAYNDKVTVMSEMFNLRQAAGTVGGKNVVASFDVSNRQVTFTLDDGTEVSTAYNYTDKGIRLYLDTDINGTKVRDITYDDNMLKMEGEGVSLGKCMVDPKTISGQVSSIGADDNAFSKSFTLAHLDQFVFYTEAEWLNISAQGGTLTVSADANGMGRMRSTVVYVINKNNSEIYSSFTVSQCDIRDILGEYVIFYIDEDGVQQKVSASLVQSGNTYSLNFEMRETNISMPVDFNQETGALIMKSGQQVGKYSSYGLIDIFIFNGGNSWTATSQNFSITIPFEYDEEVGTYGIIGDQMLYNGEDSGYDLESIYIEACETTPPSSTSDFLGYIGTISSAVIIKVPSDGAKPSAAKASQLRSMRYDIPVTIKK